MFCVQGDIEYNYLLTQTFILEENSKSLITAMTESSHQHIHFDIFSDV